MINTLKTLSNYNHTIIDLSNPEIRVSKTSIEFDIYRCEHIILVTQWLESDNKIVLFRTFSDQETINLLELLEYNGIPHGVTNKDSLKERIIFLRELQNIHVKPDKMDIIIEYLIDTEQWRITYHLNVLADIRPITINFLTGEEYDRQKRGI